MSFAPIPPSLSPEQAMAQARQHEVAGRPNDAEALYRGILQAQPGYHAAWHALGLLAFQAGQLPLAVEYLGKALALDAEVALYQRNYGELCRRLGRLDEAIGAAQRACALAPADLDAHYNLGLACADARRYPDAVRAYRQALLIDPRHGLSWNNLGSVLERAGDKAGAEQAYARAVVLDPRHAEAQNNLGALYSEQGRLDEARACFEAAIAARPGFVEAHYNLSSLKSYAKGDPHLAQLEALARQQAALDVQARIRYHFALGKALDDSGEYERAFAAYAQGNRLQHALLPVDEARADALLARIIEVFDAEFFAARRDWRGSDRAPIFIVGMPRSGTTLIEQVLCSHPAVHGAGELHDLHEVAAEATGAAPDRPFVEGVAGLDEAQMRGIGEAYAERVWRLAPQSLHISDKMPANFFYLGLIHLALPNARIVHALREPMDSCFSCYSRLFNETMDFAYDLGTLGRYFVRYMKLMEHWRKVLPPGRVLELRYEDMVADPEGQSRRLLDYCALPWDARCLNFHENERPVKTASLAQVRRPIYTDSVARWKRFERQLQPLLRIVRDYSAAVPLTDSPAAAADVERLMEQAVHHQAAGRLREAETLLRQILCEQPRHAPALHLLGVVTYQGGQARQALELVAQAIALDPSVALFHSNLAEMCRQQGRLDEAVAHGERAVELDPSLASAHSNLGIAYYDAGDCDRAEACHRRALALAPDLPQSLNNMGSILRARKDREGAMAWYRRAIDVHPDFLESRNNLGGVLVEADRAGEAVPVLEQVLAKAPDYPEALCNLGLARVRQDQIDAAIVLLARALRLKPAYPEALVGLASAMHKSNKLDQAAALLRQAIAAAPRKAEAHCLLGTVCMEQGEARQAECAYRQALEIEPELTDALTGLANLRLEAGEIEAAETLLRQAIEIKPDDLAARFHLIQARKVRPGDANLAALEAIRAGEERFASDKRVSLHYALGKAYDDLGAYERAFPHFLQGARLKRERLPYDPAVDEAQCRRIMARFDKDFFAGLQGGGEPSDLPIFVLGMPRSGTTLTEQIIASHPAVHGSGELPDLMAIAQRQAAARPQALPYPDNLDGLTRETLSDWGRDYVAGVRRRAPDARRVTDKMPANYLALGLIRLMLPNARIIHVRRNPLDTCLSCFTRLFNRHQDATYDLAELGRHYANYARLMRHWRGVLPADSFLEVRYEEIVADQEAQARRLIEFCGLEWDDACLDFHQHRRSIRTASLVQVRQPIYGSSVARWRHYEQFLAPLLEALGEFAAED